MSQPRLVPSRLCTLDKKTLHGYLMNYKNFNHAHFMEHSSLSACLKEDLHRYSSARIKQSSALCVSRKFSRWCFEISKSIYCVAMQGGHWDRDGSRPEHDVQGNLGRLSHHLHMHVTPPKHDVQRRKGWWLAHL